MFKGDLICNLHAHTKDEFEYMPCDDPTGNYGKKKFHQVYNLTENGHHCCNHIYIHTNFRVLVV